MVHKQVRHSKACACANSPREEGTPGFRSAGMPAVSTTVTRSALPVMQQYYDCRLDVIMPFAHQGSKGRQMWLPRNDGTCTHVAHFSKRLLKEMWHGSA